MVEFIFDVFMIAVLAYVLVGMFFAFDTLVLHGIISAKLRNWIDNRLK